MKLPTYSFAALLLCAATGWSQSLEPSANGEAKAPADTQVISTAATKVDSTQPPAQSQPAVQQQTTAQELPPIARPDAPASPAAQSTSGAPTTPVTATAPGEKLQEAFSMHPFTSFLIMGFSLSYERFIRPGVSYDIPLFIGLADKLYDQGRFYIGSGLGVRYYLSHAQSGGYLSPTLQFLNTTFFADQTDPQRIPGGNVFSVMGGVRYGYKFLWDHFTIDAGLGFYGLRTYGGDPGSPEEEDIGILFPMSHLSLGIPF
jgi:hypothetical protein